MLQKEEVIPQSSVSTITASLDAESAASLSSRGIHSTSKEKAFFVQRKSFGGHAPSCKECYRVKYLGPRKRISSVSDHKTCAKCQKTLPMHEFHRNNREKSGCVSRCKKCISDDKKKIYRMNKPNGGAFVSDSRCDNHSGVVDDRSDK